MNPKNPILIAAVAVVVAGFAFYHFALQPKQKEASAAKAKVADAQDRLDLTVGEDSVSSQGTTVLY